MCAALVAWLAALGPSAAAAAPPQVSESLVEVGDRLVRALCTDGVRRVLFVPGEGSGADTYRQVLDRLDGQLGACAYDRRRPDETAPTIGWFELADEMHRIHAALGLRPGYTLVGQGVGGAYARHFTATRFGEVGALLLLDPTHEDLAVAVRPGMPPAEWDALVRRQREPNMDGIREADLSVRARASRLPGVPVTVVTATRRRSGDGWDERFLNQGARRVHASIVQGLTLARHIPAQGIGRDIQVEAPELVVAEILRLTRLAQRASP
jgi:pimeloyl-ACP methyl ester carboxylesterase